MVCNLGAEISDTVQVLVLEEPRTDWQPNSFGGRIVRHHDAFFFIFSIHQRRRIDNNKLITDAIVRGKSLQLIVSTSLIFSRFQSLNRLHMPRTLPIHRNLKLASRHFPGVYTLT